MKDFKPFLASTVSLSQLSRHENEEFIFKIKEHLSPIWLVIGCKPS